MATDSTPFKRWTQRLAAPLPSNQTRWIAIGLVALLLFFNILPVLVVFYASFVAHGLQLTGEFSLQNWSVLVSQVGPVLFNTLYFTFGSATLTTVLAVVIGWIIARTNAPFGRLYYYVLLSVFFFPPVVWEETWILMLTKNGVYPNLLGLESLGVHSLNGMVFVQSIRFVPIGILLLLPLFAAVNKTLEEAAQLSGAGLLQRTKDVTLPLVMPGVLVVYLFTMIIALETFRVPLVIGLPVKIKVLAVEIYEKAQVTPVNFGVAMAEGALLVLMAIPLLYLYKRFVGQTEQYATVTGRGFNRSPINVGWWRYLLSGLVAFYILVTIIAPALMLIYTSLLPYYIPPTSAPLTEIAGNFSLEAYRAVLDNAQALGSVVNSFVVAFSSATIVVLFALIVSWFVQKTDVKYRQVIDYLAFIPIGIPSVALALGIAFVYLRVVPIGIYGTLGIFVVAFFTRTLPVNLRIVDPAIVQIDENLLDSGRVSGASVGTVIRTVLFPLVSRSLRTAWILAFAFIAMEMPIVMMLRNPRTEMISSMLYRMQNTSAAIAESFALGVLVMLLLVVITVVVHQIGPDY